MPCVSLVIAWTTRRRRAQKPLGEPAKGSAMPSPEPCGYAHPVTHSRFPAGNGSLTAGRDRAHGMLLKWRPLAAEISKWQASHDLR